LPLLISQGEELASQLTQLESELAQARVLLDEAKAGFPESVESIECDEELFEIADDCNLEITRITSSPPVDRGVEMVTYSITSFAVVVEGNPEKYTDMEVDEMMKAMVDDILEFVNTIATSEYFTNATVEMVSMMVPEPEAECQKPSATINLVFYTYQGD